MRLFLLRRFMTILMLLAAALIQSVQAAPNAHILVLNSYHPGMDWTEGELGGIKSRFEGRKDAPEFHVEYMDTKRLADATHFDNLRRLFSYKYKSIKLSAIAVTDNDAFEFMRVYHDELFPRVPVVFCGVNGLTANQLVGHPDFTGIAETADNAATIRLMLKLHPRTEQIVVIVDNTTTGQVLRSELMSIVPSFGRSVKFQFWNALSREEMSRQLSELPQNSLVLLMPYSRDESGENVSHPEIARRVTNASPVPVYSSWEIYFGYGIVGGNLATARAQGRGAGEMLSRILDGESVRRIPVQYNTPGDYIFDYRELNRFGIAKSRLPDSSVYDFQPWYVANPHLVWAGIGAIMALSMLLWALAAALIRKRQADTVLSLNLAVLQSHASALREISQGVIISDASGITTYANNAIVKISGYSKDELIGRSCNILQGPDSSEETKQLIRSAMESREPFHGDILNYRKDGTPFWNSLSIAPVFDQKGVLTQFVGVQSDITERMRAEVELRIAAKAFESQVAMLVADPNGVILRVNRMFSETTGYSADEAIGKKTSLLKSGRHDTEFYDQFWSALQKQKYWHGVIWNRRKNGSIYAVWLTINAVVSPDGEITHYVGAFSDITQNKEAEAEVHRLAYYDQLTLLPNRRLLQDRLGQALATANRSGCYGAVLFIDLDNFNTLNDTRGHDTGDLLLVQVAQRLRQALRQSDTLARLGGDDFVVVLEDLAKEPEEAAANAKNTASHLAAVIAQTYDLKGMECICTASIGICLFRSEETVEQLLKNADIAMYQAKASGRNTERFFDPEMQATLDKRSVLESDLRQALGRREFHLYFQAQVEQSGRITGAEILLRWRHPSLGFISPLDFIPLAEETGLILPIGQWVLEGACEQIQEWSESNLTAGLRVSVNVSARQFRQADFVGRLRRLLDETRIEPSLLKLELTETLVLDDIENTIVTMHELKRLGVTFSMDDFGTGYSSLAYLARLPLDELKIDKSFVVNIPGNHNNEVIAQTIITMGQSLGLKVIAEGVETEAQQRFLAEHGCNAYQGYRFGRPVPVDQFMSLLTSQGQP